MIDLDAALVKQFLDIPITQRKSVLHLNSVLDNAHWKAVVVGFRVGHSGSAYPNPVKTTQSPESILISLFLTDYSYKF